MPNQEKKVMSAQTLHKRPPKLHLGHDDKIHSATSSADAIGNLSEVSSCNATLTTMSSSPSTPTTPSTPNSPAISKPPKKRYLENGSFRCNEDQHATPQMAKLMELAKVCSNTSKSTGSSSGDFPPGFSRDSTNKQLGPTADFQVNISYNYSKSHASGDGDNLSGKVDASTNVSTYNQIPTFDVDIAGRIRDSDLFETSSSSSPSATMTSVTRSEEPLNLCTDKKTITTCQQDLISRMVDKFFCDPKESKGTLLDSFLLKMNSHKKLPQSDRGSKTTNNKTSILTTRSENNSDGEEVECVGRFKGIKFHSNDRISTSKVALGSSGDENGSVIYSKGEKKDNFEGIDHRGFLQRRSQTNTTPSISPKTVTDSEKSATTTEALCSSADDYIMETITPLKEGQRKSQRSSKGKRYKAFLTEGFLQPTKDRKQIRRNNSDEQIDCDKSAKDADTKPSNKPNKKRKALEMRDEKGSTKEKHSSEEKSRENKGNCIQQKDDDVDVHRLRKAKRKNLSTTEVQESEKNMDENEEKPDYQYCCVRNVSNAGNYLERQDITHGDEMTAKHSVLCDTQKSQSDENEKKRPIELLSNLNIDDSDSPPKLTRMDEDEDNEFEEKV